ncbi:hypothetical protein QO003_000770 [Arthrobacter silviterrae]|uniref:ImmA/IrrE family metallo-endopeptidase n=1 Tax=Arthrobacter silviterrae TaxID=2026658 RepID=A0ABX0DCS5_9MICC|nr:hypothetical protein [Arthrobacter silviterrae]MDQ0276467.1 hypothetical protein [Arthrobacter silviterrae]NGN84694.1 hypothetical protein [Arthrobacter silviterrae]
MDTRPAKLQAQIAEQSLKLPPRFTLQALQSYLAVERGTAIIVDELPDLPGTDVCGMWIGLETRDLILHATPRTPWHGQQIVLHEFGHMILRHDIGAIPAEANLSLIPNIDPATIRHVLFRGSYSAAAERAAELLADRLSHRILSKSTKAVAEHLSFGEVFG